MLAFRLSRQSLFVLACIAVASTIACSEVSTEPPRTVAVSHRALQIDDDTLNCLSGYVVVNGRYVCE